MLGYILYALLLICAAAAGVVLLPRPFRRAGLVCLATIGPLHLGILFLSNRIVPFVPTETDTFGYYTMAAQPLHTPAEIWELVTGRLDMRTIEIDGQYLTQAWGGMYVRLLILVFNLIGQSLFGYKLLNVVGIWWSVFGTTALASMMGGQRLARVILWLCPLVPTLWYPFLVLYRDGLTMGLHVVVLALGASTITASRVSLLRLVAIALAVLVLFLLRPGTIIINAVILFPIWIWRGYMRSRGRRRRTALTLSSVAIAGIVVAIFEFDWFEALGLEDPRFALQKASAFASLESEIGNPLLRKASLVSGGLLFFSSESTILSRDIAFRNPEQLRGLLNGPWFICVTPLAMLGFWSLGRQSFRRVPAVYLDRDHPSPEYLHAVGRRDVCVLVIWYVVVWLVITSFLQDFTRWRYPAVPILFLLAVWTFYFVLPRTRVFACAGWVVLLVLWVAVR